MKERELFYECEVKRRRLNMQGPGYVWFWKGRAVQDALDDADSDFRCKDCHGAVKLFRKRAANGPASHVEHLHREDSEYCSSGMHFLQATDGRVSRISDSPIS